jgi:RNA polymerase sigma-70 factor (ECF subfamily)
MQDLQLESRPELAQAERPDKDEDIKALAAMDRGRAFDLVVRRYRRRLFYHALYIVKDQDQALDISQEVFIRAHRCENLFDPDFRMQAWLFRVTTNLCLNQVRDRKRRGSLLETFHKSHRRTAAPSSSDHIFEDERRQLLLQAVDKLSEDHRNILMLKYWQDLSYNEIAEVLGVRMGTVMSRLSRAKRRLHEVISREELL